MLIGGTAVSACSYESLETNLSEYVVHARGDQLGFTVLGHVGLAMVEMTVTLIRV